MTESTALQIHADEPGAMTPMAMLDRAISSGAGIEVLTQLFALQERWEANQARKAFDAAMSAARAEIPPIIKNREVDFSTSKGRTNYRHEDLGEIARTVDPILARHGLSYRFTTKSPPNEPVTVTCIVAHRDGFSVENTLSAGRDDSGNKNSIQAIGSTITYLQRYTLKAALGLAAAADDDARKADQVIEATITEAQQEDLLELMRQTGTDPAKFCEVGKIDALEDLLAKDFENARQLLLRKKAKIEAEAREPA